MSTAALYEEFEQMVRGETRSISRVEFRDRCDQADQITYMFVARKIAAQNRFALHISEDAFEFVCPPPTTLGRN